MYRVFIFLLGCLCGQLEGQVPFAAIQQLPILQNTSFAGSKHSQRLTLAHSQSREYAYKVSSQYVSYDGFWNQKKLGFAVHLLNSNTRERGHFDTLQNFRSLFKNDRVNATYPLIRSEKMIGGCLAPKYNLALDKNRQVASYTLSPSLGIDIVSQDQVLLDHWNQRTARDPHPDTVYYLVDSIDFVESNTRATQLRLNAGIRLNSSRLILSYLFSYHYYFVTEQYHVHQGSLILNQTSTHTSTLNHRIPCHVHLLTGAYSFFNDGRYSLSLFGGTSLRKYVTKDRYINSQRRWNSLYATDKAKLNTLFQYYLSAVFRYQKILLGGSFSAFDKYRAYGINVGYQNSSFRIFTTLNATPKSTNTLEIVLSIFGRNKE